MGRYEERFSHFFGVLMALIHLRRYVLLSDLLQPGPRGAGERGGIAHQKRTVIRRASTVTAVTSVVYINIFKELL